MKSTTSSPALRVLLALGFAAATGTVFGADPSEGRDVIRGPFFSGTIKARFPGKNDTMKGIVVTLGQEKKAYVCYDTDLLRLSVAWTGNYLKFGNGQVRIEHPQPPEVMGEPVFGTKPGPGWARENNFTDPREDHQGPLPKTWAKYRGLYVNGNNVVLSYTVGDCPVLEMPGVESHGDRWTITRTFELGKSREPLTLLVCERDEATGGVGPVGEQISANKTGPSEKNVAGLLANNVATVAGVVGAPKGTAWEIVEGRIHLKLPQIKTPTSIKLVIWTGPASEAGTLAAALEPDNKLPNLRALCQGGPAHWTEPVVTKGALGSGNEPYVVDTLNEPVPNPWNAKTFFGGFDFLPDGRAAICAFHGDVWIVSGLDAKLEALTWKRYATGLFQPLGVKVVDNKIYVLGRDQITRLQDLNGDGEADYYENFNSDTVVTANYHEFCLDLHTDSNGDFYYCKGSPWPPNVESPHQGTMLKVSKDGSRLEVFATGLRAPNGMTVGPNDVITVSDNQGHWMPSSKLNLVKRGGFYGMMPAAHREPPPSDYEQPICWLPMSMDNSSGGQVFVAGDRWGPFKNHLLFSSYGKCTLFHVMTEEIDGQMQGGMVQFPLKFYSGLMRARFNPRDGQLYACGLRGWQTSGTKDGGFYRVRYTGQPVRMPYALHVGRNGVQITFTSPLDSASASNLENYSIEQWDYKYSGEYGSPDFSVRNPAVKGHDRLEIKTIQLSADKKTVFLEIADLKPAMQMKIKFNLAAADGGVISQEIYNTIHRLGAEIKLSAVR